MACFAFLWVPASAGMTGVCGNDGYVGNDGCVRGRRGRYSPNPADTSTIASSTTSQRSSNSCAVIESGGETGRM